MIDPPFRPRRLPKTVCLALLLCTLTPSVSCKRETNSTGPAPADAPASGRTSGVSAPDLAAERAGFQTHLIRHGPSPEAIEQIIQPFLPPLDAVEVEYPSNGLKLKAWASKPPSDGKKHPAVVYLHGSFVLLHSHWQAATAYRDAGFVILTPMLRGENGNPGEFQMMYGEVDDIVAAGQYVASLPYVDSSRVFVAGHSVGGTLAMLAAMVPSSYRAAAAFSGAPDHASWVRGQELEYKVYDTSDAGELRLRSPRFFAAGLRCPLYLFDGDQEDYFISSTRRLAEDAARLGKVCRFETVPGDHATSKPLAIRRSIQLFQALP